ncbi:disease resistance protein At4g27190-like [Juglans microcarpa x Juglans regia]|uniref:disease resistance protein At4g27190-like n=1 Tax=Juglans microcarpa x Juglans regia TaxID=2249226 RepID=UPI001B7F46F2|nr:disease resistance protein At4g27190-like [Juglans microcarpa x Juglans regia]
MSGMELVVAPIVSGAVVETGRPLCGSIYSTIKKIVKGPVQQLDLLESHMKSLMVRRDDAEEEMKRATQEGRVIKAQATAWVGEVDELKRKNDQIQEAKSSRCFLSCITKRYRISTKVAEHLKEIERLSEEGRSLAGSRAFNYSEFKAVEQIPGPSIKDQTASVSEDLAKIMALLSEDKNGIIGIWGMGGIGKTNLVRNLNNKLLENNSNLRFSCVIWVTVSKNLDIKKLQMGIASRLRLNLEERSGADRIAIQLHQRLLKEESFLLILDDVWKKVDLDILGVPRPEVHSGSKIILTSRSLDVCRDMLTDFNVELSVLRDEDAWKLFSRYATDVVSLEHITPLAEAICSECKGLPLAIITVGAAMRGKTNPEVWKHALNQLRRSVPCAAGVEEALYKPLKWSYDSLEGKDLKACFLYCSLFPEDFSIKIDELVWYWLAEGLINDGEKYEDFYSRVISLIENLKDACLLEDGSYEGTVKMHDVVRDVSIWMASSTCSEDGSKSLVRSGNGLKEISAAELSNSLKRVSFMYNDLERLPDESVIQCSEASTLLLQNNRRLDLIPERFLEGFKALRVLNISWTSIKSLPVSLLQLDDLRALLLNNCEDLEELPPLERLSRLQVLDLSCTGIRELPRGLEQLSNLRHLILRRTDELKAVKGGVISKLSRLEVLDMSDSNNNWKVKGGVNEEEACIEELQCLERLQILDIRLEWVPSHSCQDTIISLTNRLKGFQITIVRPDHPFNYPGIF